jgi:hypothetical protein
VLEPPFGEALQTRTSEIMVRYSIFIYLLGYRRAYSKILIIFGMKAELIILF